MTPPMTYLFKLFSFMSVILCCLARLLCFPSWHGCVHGLIYLFFSHHDQLHLFQFLQIFHDARNCSCRQYYAPVHSYERQTVSKAPWKDFFQSWLGCIGGVLSGYVSEGRVIHLCWNYFSKPLASPTSRCYSVAWFMSL